MAKGDHARFLKTFLKNPSSTGAVAPSSEALSKAMVRGIEMGGEDLVVEFGPGTGPFTKAIQEILPSPEQYLGIERDPEFVSLLRARFPDLALIEGSAEEAHLHVETHRSDTGHTGRVKAVISGLPFASLPDPVQKGILQSLLDLLPAGAEFRTFQYVHAYGLPKAVRFRKRMREIFGPVTVSGPIFWNLPPALVLTWSAGTD